MEMAQDCNQRDFRTAFCASIARLKTTLSATEPAIICLGLQCISLGPHYLQLNEHRTAGHLVLLLTSPVLVRSTRMGHGGRDSCGVSRGWFWVW